MAANFKKIVKGLRLLFSPQYRRGLSCGVGAAIEHAALVRSLPLKTLLDVGANVGQFSLLVRKEHPQAKIIACEPLKTPAENYRKLFEDDADAALHQVALGPKHEQFNMHVSKRHDSSSLLEISSLQTDQFPGTEEVGQEVVSVVPMSGVIDRNDIESPALLKIDVQGFELEVIKSAGDMLALFQWVYVEVSFASLYTGQALAHEVVSHLHDRDFVIKGVYNPSYDSSGRAVQVDLLFEKVT